MSDNVKPSAMKRALGWLYNEAPQQRVILGPNDLPTNIFGHPNTIQMTAIRNPLPQPHPLHYRLPNGTLSAVICPPCENGGLLGLLPAGLRELLPTGLLEILPTFEWWHLIVVLSGLGVALSLFSCIFRPFKKEKVKALSTVTQGTQTEAKLAQDRCQELLDRLDEVEAAREAEKVERETLQKDLATEKTLREEAQQLLATERKSRRTTQRHLDTEKALRVEAEQNEKDAEHALEAAKRDLETEKMSRENAEKTAQEAKRLQEEPFGERSEKIAELLDVRNDNAAKTTQLEELTTQHANKIARLTSEHAATLTKVDTDKDAKIERLEAEKASQASEIERLTSGQAAALTTLETDKDAQIKRLEAEKANTNVENERLKREAAAQASKIEQLEIDAEATEAQDAEIGKFFAKKDAIVGENDRLKQQLAELEKKEKEASEARKAAEKKAEKQEAANLMVCEQKIEADDKYNGLLESYNQVNKNWNAYCEEANGLPYSKLKQKWLEDSQELDDTQEYWEEEKKKIVELRKRIKDMEQDASVAKTKVFTHSKTSEAFKADVDKLRDENQTLADKLRKTETDRDTLQARVEQLEREVEGVQKPADVQEVERQKLEASEAFEQEKRQLESERDDCKKTASDLDGEVKAAKEQQVKDQEAIANLKNGKETAEKELQKLQDGQVVYVKAQVEKKNAEVAARLNAEHQKALEESQSKKETELSEQKQQMEQEHERKLAAAKQEEAEIHQARINELLKEMEELKKQAEQGTQVPQTPVKPKPAPGSPGSFEMALIRPEIPVGAPTAPKKEREARVKYEGHDQLIRNAKEEANRKAALRKEANTFAGMGRSKYASESEVAPTGDDSGNGTMSPQRTPATPNQPMVGRYNASSASGTLKKPLGFPNTWNYPTYNGNPISSPGGHSPYVQVSPLNSPFTPTSPVQFVNGVPVYDNGPSVSDQGSPAPTFPTGPAALRPAVRPGPGPDDGKLSPAPASQAPSASGSVGPSSVGPSTTPRSTGGLRGPNPFISPPAVPSDVKAPSESSEKTPATAKSSPAPSNVGLPSVGPSTTSQGTSTGSNAPAESGKPAASTTGITATPERTGGLKGSSRYVPPASASGGTEDAFSEPLDKAPTASKPSPAPGNSVVPPATPQGTTTGDDGPQESATPAPSEMGTSEPTGGPINTSPPAPGSGSPPASNGTRPIATTRPAATGGLMGACPFDPPSPPRSPLNADTPPNIPIEGSQTPSAPGRMVSR
jgi:hypothetical protein